MLKLSPFSEIYVGVNRRPIPYFSLWHQRDHYIGLVPVFELTCSESAFLFTPIGILRENIINSTGNVLTVYSKQAANVLQIHTENSTQVELAETEADCSKPW